MDIHVDIRGFLDIRIDMLWILGPGIPAKTRFRVEKRPEKSLAETSP